MPRRAKPQSLPLDLRGGQGKSDHVSALGPGAHVCVTCGRDAPYARRDVLTNDRTWFCRDHLSDDWGLPPTLAAEFGKLFFASLPKPEGLLALPAPEPLKT
jgi:hypothetical protein